MSGAFRSSVWDPPLIVSQILCMQASYYVFLGTWIITLDLILHSDLSLGQIYNFDVSNNREICGFCHACSCRTFSLMVYFTQRNHLVDNFYILWMAFNF